MTGSRPGDGGAAQETRWAVPWIKAVIDWGRWLRGDASPSLEQLLVHHHVGWSTAGGPRRTATKCRFELATVERYA